jgi:hypothetical protein
MSVSRSSSHPLKPKQSPIRQSSKVRQIDPSKQKKPGWLKFWTFLYHSSSLITIVLMGATLTVYGWTVYTQELWSQSYRRLESLQRQERELTANRESLKEYLAQQANNPGTGLVTPTTSNAIFLPPVPEVPLKEPPASVANIKNQPLPTTPLGY